MRSAGGPEWRLGPAAVGVAVALLAGIALEETLREPGLRAVAHGALVLAVLLCGALAASWWILAAAIPIGALLVAWVGDGVAFYVVQVVGILVPVVVALLAGAVLAGRWARRRGVGPRGVAGGIVACVALALGAGGVDAIRPPVDRRPAHPLTVDWRRGTYESVALRSGAGDVVVHFGPGEGGPEDPIVPAGEDPSEIGGPTSFGVPDRAFGVLRYRLHAFFTSAGRVAGWVTTSSRAQTPEGVGVGDAQDVVGLRYPAARCGTANEGSEWATFPLCEVRVCDGRLLAFGGDPIRSLWLVAETARGWGPCLAPTAVTPGR